MNIHAGVHRGFPPSLLFRLRRAGFLFVRPCMHARYPSGTRVREVFALLHPLASRPSFYSPNKRFGFSLGPESLETIEALDTGKKRSSPLRVSISRRALMCRSTKYLDTRNHRVLYTSSLLHEEDHFGVHLVCLKYLRVVCVFVVVLPIFTIF